MSSDVDFVDEVDLTPPPRRGRSKFDDGLKGATQRQVARATGRPHRTHGDYVQLTFRLPDEVVRQIETMAREAGVTKEDMKRWIVLQGVQAWKRGERPELEEIVRRAARLEW